MNIRSLPTKPLLFAATALLTTSFQVMGDDQPAADKPKLTAEQFMAKVARDTAEIKSNGAIVSSYADVVQKILPSVIRVKTYSKKAPKGLGGGLGGGGDDLDQLPPMFRQFFEEWLERRGGGNGGNGGGNGQQPAPKNRQRPQGPQKPVQTGLGSGVLLTDDGYILTNNHVVEGADELKVVIGARDGREYTAKVVGVDPQSDVALIKIDGTGLPHATLGESTKLRVGDVVLAVGSPMDLEQSVTHGIVSALGRTEMGIIGLVKGQAGYENFIQTDAAINPGNSCGPLVDVQGRVIGINTAIETRSGMFAGIGLAIPIDMALDIASQLLGGKVERGYLGVKMDRVDPSMAELLGLNDGAGVTVQEVMENSPAAKAGFADGDVIVESAGEKITDPARLRLLISAKHPGTEVKFGVVRFDEKNKKAEHLELIAKLEKLPEKLAMNSGVGGGGKNAPKAGTFLEGVKVQNLSDDNRQEFSIGEEVEGVLVTTVDENSAAAKVGLEAGDVILKVNGKSVKSIADAKTAKGEGSTAVTLKILRNGQTKYLVVKD